MSTTIELPDDLLLRAKSRADLSGMTLRALITQYVEQGLQQSELPTATGRRRSPLPVFRPSTGIPVPALNNAELQTILDEEDAGRVC